jgi:hypothetical protein
LAFLAGGWLPEAPILDRLTQAATCSDFGSGSRWAAGGLAAAPDATGTAEGRDMGPSPRFKIGPYYQRAGPLEFPVGLHRACH